MNTSRLLKSVINTMMEYQKINNIKGECITNTQILYDIIKAIEPTLDVKIKAVIVVANDDNITYCVKGHLVLVVDNGKKVLDPSYEVASYENSNYLTNVNTFIKFLKNNYNKKQQTELFNSCGKLPSIIESHIRFVNFANRMNDGDFYRYVDYYNNLFNYIQEKHKHQFIMVTNKQMKNILNKQKKNKKNLKNLKRN